MSKLLAQIHERYVPKFNPIIANGVAVAQMETALEFIDNAMRMSATSFPPELKYLGYSVCTVQKEFEYIIKKRNPNSTVELAPSDVYLVNFKFSWNDEVLEDKPIFIPFLNKGGLIHLRGKRFTVMPVLADETISVSKSDIFVPFLSAKVTFKKMTHYFKVDGNPDQNDLVWSKIHNHDPARQPRRATRENNTVRCLSTIPHYLFCKFGVKKTFELYCDNLPIHFVSGEVDRTKFPEEDWVVWHSSGNQPRSVKTKAYVPSSLKILTPRSHINHRGVRGLIAGLLYVVDHYPHRITEAELDGSEDEIRLWRVLLGHVVFRNKDSEGELENRINEHFLSLDQYVDNMTREGLEAEGYPVRDLYDLMAILIFNYSDILTKTDPASMYNKMFAVNRYVLADIIKSISYFKYKITSIKNRALTASDVNKLLSKHLKPEIIFNNLSSHNEIVPNQCAGDSIMFNYTSKVILQEKATGVIRRKTPVSFKDNSKFLHSSLAVAGSILALPKSEPTGRTVINPYLPLDHTWKIKKPRELAPLLDYIQTKIQRG